MSKVRALYHIVFGTHKRVPSITDEHGIPIKASGMVFDQAVTRQAYSPRRPVPAVAVAAHRGVNEKQPLRVIRKEAVA